jgi:hypothetical protein
MGRMRPPSLRFRASRESVLPTAKPSQPPTHRRVGRNDLRLLDQREEPEVVRADGRAEDLEHDALFAAVEFRVGNLEFEQPVVVVGHSTQSERDRFRGARPSSGADRLVTARGDDPLTQRA